MREAGWHHGAQRHIRGGSSPTPLQNPPTPPPLLFHPPSSLLQSWACTLAVASAAEARLLFKSALPFGLFSFFIPPFFFRWCQQNGFTELSLPLTHLIYKATKEGREWTNRERGITKQDGDSSSTALPHSSPLMTFVVSVEKIKKTHFQSSPSFPNNAQIQVGSRGGSNVDQLCVGL